MSQFASLNACQIPFRFGFPSAVRGALYVCDWLITGPAGTRRTAATVAARAMDTFRTGAPPFLLFGLMLLRPPLESSCEHPHLERDTAPDDVQRLLVGAGERQVLRRPRQRDRAEVLAD